MRQLDYSKFDLADFAADEYFVTWVIHPNERSDSFWTVWQVENPEKGKVIHEARLLVLLMQSRKVRMHENQKELLWDRIHQETIGEIKEPQVVKLKKTFTFIQKIAAAIIVFVLASAVVYLLNIGQNSSNQIAQNPKGKKSVIYLEDGTKVWLNADSKISYSSSFEGKKERVVELEGEAFFDVAEDKTKPFIVKTTDLQVRVLGTAFNVRSFREEKKIETTLLRGRVEVNRNKKSSAAGTVILEKNQQAVFSKDSDVISVLAVKPYDIATWKDGVMVFDNTPFSEMTISLERWYGVEIKLKDESSKNCRFSTTFHNEPITKVLELLKASSGMDYEIKGKTIMIYGSLCQEENRTR